MAEPRIIELTPKWIAADKPSGWLSVRPTRPGTAPVLSDWLQAAHPEALICHRLDIQTSGVILFARDAEAHREANAWFASRRVKKTYHCLCAGSPSLPVLKLTGPVRGQPATTQALVKERFAGPPAAFLAEVRIVSGRRHQIRIHLSGVGHPLLGDTEYGGPAEVPRVALHSSEIELPTGERFIADWPEDFRCWIEALRANRSL